MATELGLDPSLVRPRELSAAPARQGRPSPTNDLDGGELRPADCVDWVERASGWLERKAKAEG
jgi:hypothetical protein